jgi:hypothetical protein
MHSFVYGTPVITHNSIERQMPEFEAIISGRTGAFFKYDDLDSLINEIAGWIEKNNNRDHTRKACYEIIDKYYNTETQVNIFCAAIEGRPR